MAGKPTPDCGGRVGTAVPTFWSVAHEQEEVHHGIPAEAVYHVAHPVRRVFKNGFPEVSAARVPHKSLSNEYSRNPDGEDANVQHKKPRFRRYLLSHDGPDVNPKAEDQSGGGNSDEQPKEGT